MAAEASWIRKSLAATLNRNQQSIAIHHRLINSLSSPRFWIFSQKTHQNAFLSIVSILIPPDHVQPINANHSHVDDRGQLFGYFQYNIAMLICNQPFAFAEPVWEHTSLEELPEQPGSCPHTHWPLSIAILFNMRVKHLNAAIKHYQHYQICVVQVKGN